MFRNERLELKVGLFIGMGIFIMFLIVFSISDFYMLKEGYGIEVLFDYVNGITDDSPVRLAGVHVGEVKKIGIIYDGNVERTRVKLDLWINGDIRIAKDSIARINTLGLLGEQYLEISPGQSDEFLKNGDRIVGKNPVNMGEQMENVRDLVGAFKDVMLKISSGEGNLGKFLMDDTLYSDLTIITGRLRDGKGTIGKLLVEEKIYDDLELFVDDIKAHPWKLLHKTSDRKKKSETDDGDRNQTRGFAL